MQFRERKPQITEINKFWIENVCNTAKRETYVSHTLKETLAYANVGINFKTSVRLMLQTL